MSTIDRKQLVGRHDVRLTTPDPGIALSVGNGDFAFTADITGLQTFTEFHTPPALRRPSLSDPRVTNTCTMSTWGWDTEPNPGYTLEQAMTAYDTRRGPVTYPDRPSMVALMSGTLEEADRAGRWFVENPFRVDLGRLGLVLRPTPDAEPEADPAALTGIEQHLDLWSGVLTSRFSYLGAPVEVVTVAHPEASAVATRVTSPLLATGQLALRLRFGRPIGNFLLPNDWDATDGHTSELEVADGTHAVVHRGLATARYDVALAWTDGTLTRAGTHRFVLATDAASVELVAGFSPVAGPGSELAPSVRAPGSFAEVVAASEEAWAGFWNSGAAVDFAGSTDPRAHELERRVVLSQYLTRVHCCGVMPPQETGLVTNSWGGKSHLEMHWWHAAHFPAWGRPELLERSLAWYEAIHPMARVTAQRQGYAGARWPKQVGPEGRESPSDIGSLLVWQQPHLLYYAELLWNAHDGDRDAQVALATRLGPLLDDTAAFMVSFADEVDGVFHLGPPVMPTQEFYGARETADPTYELAYWAFGLELAGRFRERRGLARVRAWEAVRTSIAAPAVTDGHYAAVATETETRTDDHPSMLMALGFVPPTGLVGEAIMRATLDWVLAHWGWDTAWGWDFPVMAMTATRLGDPQAAVDCLLRPAIRNTHDADGHNLQVGWFLPLYLPGNGGLLAAVSLMVAGWDGGPVLPGIPTDGTWTVRHEGFIPWPGPVNN